MRKLQGRGAYLCELSILVNLAIARRYPDRCCVFLLLFVFILLSSPGFAKCFPRTYGSFVVVGRSDTLSREVSSRNGRVHVVFESGVGGQPLPPLAASLLPLVCLEEQRLD